MTDNKNQSRDFYKCLGMSNILSSSMMAIRKVYSYQIYDLEEPYKKIFVYLKMTNGLVIITTKEKYFLILEKIKYYTTNISHIPILIVVEGITDLSQIEKISKSNVRYELSSKKLISNYLSYWGMKELSNFCWFNSHVIFNKPLPINMLGLKELVKQFIDCTLNIVEWNHFNRLRLIYFSLKNFGYEKTIDQSGWLCVCWNKYNSTTTQSNLWNYTLTKFWIDQVFSLMLINPKMDFAQLYLKFYQLSDNDLYKKYYSNKVIFSDKAKIKWIEPDLY